MPILQDIQRFKETLSRPQNHFIGVSNTPNRITTPLAVYNKKKNLRMLYIKVHFTSTQTTNEF
jgi:hypothetical protein